jgi:hypothetical protein
MNADCLGIACATDRLGQVPTVTAGTLVKQRRSLKMTARELNDIDRDVLEVRQYIGHQRDVIRQLADGGHMQALPQAQETLRLLEDKLQALLMRRKAILDEFRRPRPSQ